MQNNYPNPLDNFRSHSYNFILTIANTTEALRKMIDQASNGGSSYIQAVNSATLGEAIDLGGDSAYLLLDTRRFSQFSVSNFEMSHKYGTGSPANPTVPIALSKMKVVDSTGITFMNFLMDIMRNKIQSTRASAFFMLTVIFNGHTDEHPQQTHTISTCFIPMLLINLHFEFTSTGSLYDLEFAEVEGNPGSAMPQMVDLGDVQAVSTENTTNTLNGMLQALEDRLNVRSMQFYQKYNNEAYERSSVQDKKNFSKAGKLVQYMITIPDDWKNYRINTAGKSQNVEQVFLTKSAEKNKANAQTQQALDDKVDQAKKSGDEKQIAAAQKERASYHSFSYTTSILDAIKIILESSKEYLDMGSEEKKKNGTAVLHKTLVSVTSDANTYMVHYDIYPYYAPKVDGGNVVKTGDGGKGAKKLSNGDIANLITYDYLFSGRNSHVLDLKIDFAPTAAVALDMDLDLGQQRFAENASTGQKQEKIKDTGQQTTSEFNPLLRPGEPIFIPMKTKDQQTNFSNMSTEEYKKDEANQLIKAKQEHMNTLAVLHFVASMHSQITVRGNPNIIRKYADRNVRGGIPKHPTTVSSPDTLRALRTADASKVEDLFNKEIKGRLSSEKSQYIANYVAPRIKDNLTKSQGTDPLLHGSDVATTPLFMKVNIFAPNLDNLGNQLDGGLYTNKFFYDGVYMVLQIFTEFNGGTFRHTMNLIPYDLDGSFSKSTQAVS